MILSLLLLMGMQQGPIPSGAGEPVSGVRIANCDEKVGLGGHIYTLRELGYCPVTPTESQGFVVGPEPTDVPAIYEWYTIQCPPCNKHEATICSPPCARTHTTCVDKTRILEHDEQSVPLYWCRKVQTGGKP